MSWLRLSSYSTFFSVCVFSVALMMKEQMQQAGERALHSASFSERSDVFCRRFGTFLLKTSELFRKALAFSPFRKRVIQAVLVTPITKTTKEKFVPAVSILCFNNKTRRSNASLSHDNAWSGDILSGYCCHGNKTHTRRRRALFDGAPQRPACFLPEKIYGHKP